MSVISTISAQSVSGGSCFPFPSEEGRRSGRGEGGKARRMRRREEEDGESRTT